MKCSGAAGARNGMEWNKKYCILFFIAYVRMCVCVRIIPEQGGGLLQRCTCSV
jgi:hypothetical protein